MSAADAWSASGLACALRRFARLSAAVAGVEVPRVAEVADVRTLSSLAASCGAPIERRAGALGFEHGGVWFKVKEEE